VQRQIDRLGSVDIHIDVPEVPYPSHGQGHSATVWKWAAVLAAGFLTGFLTGRLVEHPRIVPVPQTLTTVQATTSSFGHVTCRAENLKTFRK
jgi:hypothetical protein